MVLCLSLSDFGFKGLSRPRQTVISNELYLVITLRIQEGNLASLDMLLESRTSTRPSSLSRNGAGHHSLPTPHDVCNNKRQQQPSHQLDPCNRGNNGPIFWQVDPQHRPGSPGMQIRIAVIRSSYCYLHFHILNLAHQLPTPDYLCDYTSSCDPIDMARECYAPRLGMSCYWRRSRGSKL